MGLEDSDNHCGGEAVGSTKKLLLDHFNQQDAVHGQLQLDETF
jgi:hypothetical protein